MLRVKCYEVWGHTDTTEGRGPMKVVARFSNPEAAKDYVRSPSYGRWCVMGYQSDSDLRNIREVTLMINESLEDLLLADRESLKISALSKLTKEEREVLGLE